METVGRVHRDSFQRATLGLEDDFAGDRLLRTAQIGLEILLVRLVKEAGIDEFGPAVADLLAELGLEADGADGTDGS